MSKYSKFKIFYSTPHKTKIENEDEMIYQKFAEKHIYSSFLGDEFLIVTCIFKCSDTRVSDKRVFYTSARTLPPSSKVSKSVVALLIAFQWHRFVVVSGTHPASGSEVKEAIETALFGSNFKKFPAFSAELNYCSQNKSDEQNMSSSSSGVVQFIQ
ncbi:hypothetical protein HHI36_015197 [Cryptolaemus montrouzieri]|uniref:Receptor ligand binding region domain-containing protein n=1 Tax=Cryptolaemus montrouzieri TaxID=559131 RepID=A0ABD2N636_9CUCU